MCVCAIDARHQLSEGQRRRVQIFSCLLAPFELLLLDEVTSCLDALYREDLLAYLKRESERRSATIIYTTHILDGMDDWANDLVYLERGEVRHRLQHSELQNAAGVRGRSRTHNRLLVALNCSSVIVLQWMRESKERDLAILEDESGSEAHHRVSTRYDAQLGGFAAGRLLHSEN